jgi:riboflavin kinase/FMN adenylyltransferase
MRILRGLPAEPLDVDCAVTIGAFDGVHVGHRALIERTLERARADNGTCVVITFDPHPVEVLAPQVNLLYLTSNAERTRLIEAAGADILCVLPFTVDTSRTRARDFVRPLLDTLRMRALVIGYDFTLGYKREGNTQFLRTLGNEWGFSVEVLDPVVVDGETVSSTRIRKLLASGSVESATNLLGHRPTLSGRLDSGLALQLDARQQSVPDGSYNGFVGRRKSAAEGTPCVIRFQSGIPRLSPSDEALAMAGQEVVLELLGHVDEHHV